MKDFGQRRAIERRSNASVGLSAERVAQFFAALLRSAHGGYLFICGLFIAALVAIPVLNLLTPLFATAFMVRVHQRIAPPARARRDAGAAQAAL